MTDDDEGRDVVPQGEREGERFGFYVFPLKERSIVRLGDVVSTLWSGKILILSITFAFTLLAIGAAFFMTPVFRAETLVKPVTGESQNNALAAFTGQLGGAAALAGLATPPADTAEYIATLRSRSFAENFIKKNDLLPILFSEQWSDDSSGWRTSNPGDVPTMWDAFQLFDSIRHVSEDAMTGLVTISVDWTDADTAARWANGLISEANNVLRDRAVTEAERSLEYLEASLQESSPLELRQAVFRLMATEMKNAMLATVRTEYAFRTIDPAVPPERRHRPNRVLLTVIGAVTGVLVGILLVFFRQMMTQHYRRS